MDSDKTWFARCSENGRFEGVALGVIGMIDDNDIAVIYDLIRACRLVDVPASTTFINAEQQTQNVSSVCSIDFTQFECSAVQRLYCSGAE